MVIVQKLVTSWRVYYRRFHYSFHCCIIQPHLQHYALPHVMYLLPCYFLPSLMHYIAEAVILKEQAENEAERQKLLKLFEEHLKRQKEEEEERKRVS